MVNLLIVYGSEPSLVGVYIMSGLITLVGLLSLIGTVVRIVNTNKNEMLDNMLKNGDISLTVYKKYKK